MEFEKILNNIIKISDPLKLLLIISVVLLVVGLFSHNVLGLVVYDIGLVFLIISGVLLKILDPIS